MKNNGMIHIFYILFLPNALCSHDSQEKPHHSHHMPAHFHYLSKLTTSMHILATMKIDKAAFKKIIAHSLNDSSYTSPPLHQCIQHIHSILSLKPLFTLWHTLNACHFLDDYELKRELCIFILLFYKNALTYVYGTEKRFLLEQINAYYQNIHTKELHELLEILNIIAQEIKPLLESMTTSKITTWKVWIEKYWMPIMVACITIIIKIMIYEKKSEKEAVKI